MNKTKDKIVSNIDGAFHRALHNFARTERLEYDIFLPINNKYVYAQKDNVAFLIDIDSRQKSECFLLSIEDLKTGKYYDEEQISDNTKFHLVSKDEVYGMIDSDGKVFLMKEYAVVSEFSERFAGVMSKDKLWGFVNEKLEEVIPCKYNGVGFFQGGFASILRDNIIGFIDRNGKEIISPKYEEVKPFIKGVAKVKLNNKWKCIDTRETEFPLDDYEQDEQNKQLTYIDYKDLYWPLNIIDENIIVTANYEYNLNLTDKKVISFWESC